MIHQIIFLDQLATSAIIYLPHPLVFTTFFQFMSFAGSYGIVWIMLSVFFLYLEKKLHHLPIFFLISVLATTYLSSDILLKNFFKRPRPKLTPKILSWNANQAIPTDYSFPSTHSAFSFAAYTVLSHFHKKKKLFFLLLANLIAFSRVYLGYHYALDVIFGALLGLFIAKIGLHLNQCKKLK